MERITIKGHRLYEIDREGNVYRKDGKCKSKFAPLKHSFSATPNKSYPNGYMSVTLVCSDAIDIHGNVYDKDTYTHIKVHRLLAIAFLPNPENKPEVNHKDGNKLNNSLDNLEWVTHQENIRHDIDTGLRVFEKGNKSPMYGKRHSAKTKYNQSLAKIGEKHPKFKGWYVVNGFKYDSASRASIQNGVSVPSILRWCKAKKNYCYFLPKTE